MRSPEQILSEARTIAVVGASPKEWRPSHYVMRYLLDQGYRCTPVRPPDCEEVHGIRCVDSLLDLAEPPDLVNVFRRPEHCADVARAAVEAGAGAVWLQLGIVSAEARAICEEAGLDYVEDACSIVVHRSAGIGPVQ